MTVKIAYLGPPGTFSEEAAARIAEKAELDGELAAYATIVDCAEALEDQVVDYAVVPLENSLEGSVHDTLDVLITSLGLSILAELVLDIQHHLLVASDAEIVRVYSHPQALAQCRRFLRRTLPAAEMVPVLSTAEAAAIVAKEKGGSAAISSKRAATRYGLDVAKASIQDSGSRTRFIVLGRDRDSFAKPQKTSVLFAVKNEAGSLFRVLQAFAVHQVNLTRIESRPAKSQLGEYLFFVDLDGTPSDQSVKTALREVVGEAMMLKLLGSYPVLT